MTSDRSTITVLVVEQEGLTRRDLVETLRRADYDVLEASDAREALGHLESGKRIDAVITDTQIGGDQTGWDFADRFRAARSDVPIVYTSGNAVDHARMVSGSLFFGKPYRTSNILKVFRTFGRTASAEQSLGPAIAPTLA